MVTEHDRASERLIVGRLAELRPDDAVVGEEGTDTAGPSGVRWLVDPIDGTTNFVYGLAGYNVSIAARTDAGTQVGAVYVPATDELFSAVRGGGARCNGAPIRCSTTTDLHQALVATGFSYLPNAAGPGRPHRRADPPDPRHPPLRRSGLRPVLRRRRTGRRLLRAVARTVGRRRRRADRRRGRLPHRLVRRRSGAPLERARGRRPRCSSDGGGLRRCPEGAHARTARRCCQTVRVGTRILSVEDDERIRTAVKLALEDEGWTVDEAASGEDAIDAVPPLAARRRADRHHAPRHRRLRAVPHAAPARATCRS